MGFKELVDEAIAENKVTIFSKSYCPYCSKTKGLFSSDFKEVATKVFELDKLEDGAAIQNYLYEKTGQRTVPNVFINKEHIGGNDAVQALNKQGKLAGLLNA